MATPQTGRAQEAPASAPAPQTQPATQAQAAGPVWESLPAMPMGVFDAAAGVSGRQVVITGGINQTGQASNVVQVMDLDSGHWTAWTTLQPPRCFHAQVTLADGRVLVVGGQTGQLPDQMKPLADGQIIDPRDGKAQGVPPLSTPVPQPTAHLLADGKVVVVGQGRASILDPGGPAWIKHIPLREERQAHASVLLADGRLVIAGGIGQAGIEVVDLQRGISRRLAAELPEPLDDLAMAAIPQGVWIIGGQNSGSGATTDRTWILNLSDPAKSRLEEGPRLGVAGGMADHRVVTTGDLLVVVGGEAESGRRDTEHVSARVLSPATRKVWSLPPLTSPHDDAVAISDGPHVYVFGGYRMGKAPVGNLTIPIASGMVERLTLPRIKD